MPMSEAADTAETLITWCETVSIFAVGVNADELRFTPEERAKILAPLARSIQRLSPYGTSKFQPITDLITVCGVGAMYGLRVFAVQQAVQYRRDHPPASEQGNRVYEADHGTTSGTGHDSPTGDGSRFGDAPGVSPANGEVGGTEPPKPLNPYSANSLHTG